MIESFSSEFSIERMCQAFMVSRSGYYKFLTKGRHSKRYQLNEKLKSVILNIWIEHRRVYGSPRITAMLIKMNYRVNVKRVAGIMKASGIKAIRRKKYHHTTNSRHNYPASANLLKQNFTVTGINKIWLTDITYIRTREGYLYLAVIMDLCSRMLVGYRMNNHIRTTLVTEALDKAVTNRGINQGLILHSDQGIQYASETFRQLLGQYEITQSMSQRGNCYDNAPMESFFHTLKTELVYLTKFNTRKEAEIAIRDYIDNFYVGIRIHSSLNYKSPKDFEESILVPK